MTPWDLIIWALAAAAALLVIGVAIVVVLAGINGVRDARTAKKTDDLDSTPIFRGKA